MSDVATVLRTETNVRCRCFVCYNYNIYQHL